MKTLLFLLGLVGYVFSDCGQTPIPPDEVFIVGGKEAKPYSWPWQIVFCRHSWLGGCSLMCGGSVIDKNWIMTAGHCVEGSTDSPKSFRVKLGVFDQRKYNEKGEVMMEIEKIHLHPKFENRNDVPLYDVALLKLKSPVTFTDHIQPVCLAKSDAGLINSKHSATITGWGTKESGGLFTPSNLRQVTVPLVNQTVCDKAYGDQIFDTTMFCAGIGGKDSCQGDSGGPLVMKHSDGRWFQYGVVSWGRGCAQKGYPALFVHVLSDCGKTPIPPDESRIVGGQVAKPYSWPWQTVFCESGFGSCSLLCGGSVIDNEWVMTAGHCVYGSTHSPGRYRVKMGVYNQEETKEKGEVVARIKKIHLHPKYDPDDTTYDIALLQLKTPVKFTNHIQPVCLPSSDQNIINDDKLSATVTGWGTTQEGGDIPNKLHQVVVPFVDQTKCNKEYQNQVNDKVMFCAGVGGKDSCQGDSGGPIVRQKNDKWYQYGIVSWGNGCAEPGFPGVYSRVTAYCDFIKKTTGKDLCQS